MISPGARASRPTHTTTETELSFAVELAPRLGWRMSEGLVVDASILARLLGMPLLQLEAHVTFVPADFRAGTGGHWQQKVEHPTTSAYDGDLRDAVDLLAHASRTLMTLERDSAAGSNP